MGMVAGSMGSLRPLVVKLLGHISSLSHNKSVSAANSGESGSDVARKKSLWGGRGAGSRVQGDSVLIQTTVHEEVLPTHVMTVVPMETIESKGG